VRVPRELYNCIVDACGGEAAFKAAFPTWARRAFSAAVGAPRGGNLGDAQLSGFEEGRRQGWAHANAVFRQALQRAAAELKGGK
jgi:hypothetical protein